MAVMVMQWMFHFHVREAGNCKAVVQGEAVYSGILSQWRQIGAATVVVGAFWCIGEASREA